MISLTNKRLVAFSLAAAISLLTFAVYLQALRNDFVLWDDGMYIYDNRNIRTLDPTFLKWAFTDHATTGNWHPLTWISYALDYAVWGKNPAGYHLTGILLHSANTFVLLYLVAHLLHALSVAPPPPGNDSLAPRNNDFVLLAGAAAALLFGLHPLHVEPAVWAADRRDLLCALFYGLSMLSYASYAGSRTAGDSPAGGRVHLFPLDNRYILAMLFLVLAGMSKPMAVTLPAVFLILDWHPFARFRFGRQAVAVIAEKIPFIVVSLALSVAAYLAQRSYHAVVPWEALPLATRLLVACRSVVIYLWKMVFPVDLLPFYSYPQDVTLSSFYYSFLIAAVVCMTTLFAVLARRKRIFLSVWLFYIVTLLPVLGIVQIGGHSMADRYAYIPSFGPCLLAGAGAAWIWRKTGSQIPWGVTVRRFCAVSAAALVISMVFATSRQIGIWKDTVTLWSRVIEKEPDRVPLAYSGRGLAFREQGRYDLALKDLSKAISMDPNEAKFYNNRGIVYGEQGKNDRAIADFTSAILLDPGFAGAYSNRGLKFEETGQLDRALEDLTTAIRLAPSMGDAYLNRGLILERMGRFEEAIQDYGRSIELDPADHLAWSYRGIAYSKQGRAEEAIEDHSQSLALKPDYIDGYLYRGDLFRRTGNAVLAIKDYQKACDLGNKAACNTVRTIEGR